jgi:hypothetical protein
MRKLLLFLVCVVLLTVLAGGTRSMGVEDPTPKSHLAMLPYIVNGFPPPPTPPPEGDIYIYDCDGQRADAQWLYDTFGAVEWQAREGARLVALRCREGPASLEVHVEDEAGHPLENIIVMRYWPDAEFLPEELAWDATYNRGDRGPTNVEGNIGFGMGGGEYYDPSKGQVGVEAIWVGGPNSYLLTGLGWLAGTNHTHLNSEWVLDADTARTLQAQNWGFTPGAVVYYEDQGYGEPVPVVSWPAR